MPGLRGGGEWSGASVDKETGIMYVSVNDIPNVIQLVELEGNIQEVLTGMPMSKAGSVLYERKCAACHGNDLKGNQQFPPLDGIGHRLKPDDLKSILEKPRGMMPSFNSLSIEDKDAIAAFLFKLKDGRNYKSNNQNSFLEGDSINKRKRYRLKGYQQLKDQDGYPGVKPPWGTLNAVDLNTGKALWKIPLGEYPELAAKGKRNTGTQLFGGGIVTAGGLIFIGASQDEKFGAIDKASGKTIWEYKLPAGGYATPSTYEVDGKQYVVIAAGGGGRQLTKAGDYYIAFALP